MLEKLHNLLDYQITEPKPYGAFHLGAWVIIIAVTFFLCLRYTRCDEKTERKIALGFWIVIVALEVYKQLNYSISFEEGKLVWDYRWYAFPFQFCSSPLYVLPLIAFAKNERVRDAAIAFMGTFSLFAGIAVCIYPNDVFVETLGIDIQTMVHHGSQVALGVFFAARHKTKEFPASGKTYFLEALSVFSILSAIAIAMDVIGYKLLLALGIDETFNMFYISPYFNCTLPVLSAVDEVTPYPVFLAIYLLGFALVAVIMMALASAFMYLLQKIKGKRKTT